jgi:hypothetical protein
MTDRGISDRDSIPDSGRNFISAVTSGLILKSAHALSQWELWTVSPGIKWPKREPNYSGLRLAQPGVQQLGFLSFFTWRRKKIQLPKRNFIEI